MINNYRNQFEQKGLNLRLDNDSDVPKTLLGDEERIKQILSNLLENSLKFTDKGFVKIEIKSKKISAKEFDLHFLVEGFLLKFLFCDWLQWFFEKKDSLR